MAMAVVGAGITLLGIMAAQASLVVIVVGIVIMAASAYIGPLTRRSVNK